MIRDMIDQWMERLSGFFDYDPRETDFMSELDAASEMRPATQAVVMLYTIIALVVFIFVWAAISEVEEITHGQGQVVPSQEIQVVQSLEGGILSELLVREGQRVEKDQVLLRISDIQFSSEEYGTEARFLSLRAKKARLEAEASGIEYRVPDEVMEKNPKVASNELALYHSRQKELENAYSILDDKINQASAGLADVSAQVETMRKNLTLLEEELEITRDMVKQRAVSKLDAIRLERELAGVTGEIQSLQEKKKGLESELEVAKRERAAQEDQFRSSALAELNDVESELAGLQGSLKSIGDRVYRTELRSPVDGIINNIALTTIGGVIEPAQRLVEVVPLDDELKIIARVMPHEIAFLHPGQDVKVKITAYDPQKYGALDGTLTRIGANSITDHEGNIFFEIEVRTDKNYMGDAENPLPITPGMVADTDVITGKRTILEYLMKPIMRARYKVFTER